ncbi:MAG: carbohydrate porin [Rhizobacter sp.]
MKTKPLFLAMMLAGAAGSALAAGPTIDFSGYIRAGTGLSTRGGNQVCFGLAGADTKYRLGNECDYVVEPNFDAKLADFEGADWHVHVMPTNTYYGWGDGAANGAPDQLMTRFNQVYTYGSHVAALGNGTVWAGRRFYNRLQTGINDQFLENNDGDGAGLEDIDLGVGKLSVAFMMNPNGTVNDNRYSLPIRLTGVKDMPNGELAFYVTPSKQVKADDQSANPNLVASPISQPSGLAIGVYQTFNGLILGGNTLIGVKYDKLGETKNTRVVFQQSANFGVTAVDFITEYRNRTAAAQAGNKWFTIGARADTSIGGPFRFLVEAGHDQVKPENGGDKLTLNKLTLALAASAGKEAGSRPTVRLFVTTAAWNDAAKTALNSNTQAIFGDKKAGTTIGFQGETWW